MSESNIIMEIKKTILFSSLLFCSFLMSEYAFCLQLKEAIQQAINNNLRIKQIELQEKQVNRQAKKIDGTYDWILDDKVFTQDNRNINPQSLLESYKASGNDLSLSKNLMGKSI